jgi:hypothetical protein
MVQKGKIMENREISKAQSFGRGKREELSVLVVENHKFCFDIP